MNKKSAALGIIGFSFGVLAAVVRADPVSANEKIADVSVEGTAFVVRLTSGRVLQGADLQGATLSLDLNGNAAPQRIRIDAVHTDPGDPEGEITLYHFLAIDAQGAATELCAPDWKGERWGFPVRGQWDEEGRHLSGQGYTLTCGDGAQGKCVRFGYKPWKTLKNGISLEPYHQACVRAVRADYCGGHGTTRDGMAIDIYDSLRIQKRDPKGDQAQGLTFEAAWTPTGAVCVAHPRVPENVTLDQLAKDCPRLAGHLGPAACTEEKAGKGANPALLYIQSR